MNVNAVILADLDTTPLGTRSRLAEPLAGVPVLRRTVERVAAATQLQGVFVLAPSAQVERVQSLLAGLNPPDGGHRRVQVHAHDAPPPPLGGAGADGSQVVAGRLARRRGRHQFA